jgi:nicotinamide mononucleotide transporter
LPRKLNLPVLLLVSVAAVLVGLFSRWRFGGDWFEFASFVTGVVAVYLVAEEHIINWPIGLINVSIYAYVFFQSRLYADMSLQFFFFALGVHGWYQWLRGGTQNTALTISRLNSKQWLWVAVVWVVGVAIYYPIIHHFNGAAPFIDSSLAVASIIAQVLLNRKKLENWILWIIVDIVYIPLYISRGLYLTAVLCGLLLSIAIAGLVSWKRTFDASTA